MWETTNLVVAYDTPLQQLEALKVRLRAYMADNSREWGGCEVYIDNVRALYEIPHEAHSTDTSATDELSE